MKIQLDELDVGQSDRLGLAFPASDLSTYAALADAGFGKVRIGVSWDLIQPSEGTWNWRGLDNRIAALKANGIEPLLTFYSDADWATSPGDNAAKNLMPDDLDDWAAFVGAVAARYGSTVDEYQVANEFAGIDNRSGGWASTPDALVDYVNTAYDAVKAADKGSTFIMGGVASLVADMALVNQNKMTFEPSQALSRATRMHYTVDDLRSSTANDLVEARLLTPLREAKFDMAAVHLYGDRSLDDDRIGLISELSGKSVTVTESGAPTYDGSDPTAADYFISSALSDLGALAAGADTVFWFHDYDSGSTYYNQLVALRDADGNPKPSMWAKKLLAVYLTDDAKVSSPAEGVYRIDSPTEGDALIGMASALTAANLSGKLGLTDFWVLEDPATGLLRRLEKGEKPEADDFLIVDDGWLASESGEGALPVPQPVLSETVGLTVKKGLLQSTQIVLTQDGETVGQSTYQGLKRLPEAHLTKLGLTLSADGDEGASGAVSLRSGHLGVVSTGETKADAQKIDGAERLVIDLGEAADHAFPAIAFTVGDAQAGETALLYAYRDGVLVASDEVKLGAGEIRFDPGVDFDRLEIGAGLDDAFSLRSLAVEWYDLI